MPLVLRRYFGLESTKKWKCETEAGRVMSQRPCLQSSAPVTTSDLLCQNIDQDRSFRDDAEKEENTFLDDCDAVYVSEQEETLDITDLQNNSEEQKVVIAELICSNNSLKKLNEELQNSLDLAEDCNLLLKTENAALKTQVKMKQSVQEVEKLNNEFLESYNVKQQESESTNETGCRKHEKEIETLKNQIEVLNSEISCMLSDRDMQEDNILQITKQLTALQHMLEDRKCELDQANKIIHKRDLEIEQLENSVFEYKTIKQDLKEKIKEMEDQLTLSALNGGGGNFMYVDGTLSAATQHSISLGEELGLPPVDKMYIRVEDIEDTEEFEGVQQVMHKEEKTVEKVADFQLSSMRLKDNNVKSGFRVGVSLVPLGLLSVILPLLYFGAGMSSADLIRAVWLLIQPYSCVYHNSLPPV